MLVWTFLNSNHTKLLEDIAICKLCTAILYCVRRFDQFCKTPFLKKCRYP